MELQNCDMEMCPAWDDWSAWSDCSATCGGGEAVRTRICTNGDPETGDCLGETEEIISCNDQACEYWNDWSQWSECSVTCGGGESTRARSCQKGELGDDGCVGESNETIVCNDKQCEIWLDWGEWSECSVSCGGGARIRARSCDDGIPGVGSCAGDSMDDEPCNDFACPSWTEWTEWSDCDVTCGIGERARDRSCLDGQAGVDCEGEAVQFDDCSQEDCPVWSSWGAWSICSTSCGEGSRIRVRTCPEGEVGVDCLGESMATKSCMVKECPTWTEWNAWGSCSATCGEGVKSRLRSCTGGLEGVDCEGEYSEEEICELGDCPTWALWGEWSECSETCGDGQRIRIRSCDGGVVGVGCLGDSMTTEKCSLKDCPTWGPWQEWSECSASCGLSDKLRLRQCNGGVAGVDCDGSDVEKEQCEFVPCTFWGEWSIWSDCSATCGDGERTRDRVCVDGEAGVDCEGDSIAREMCNNKECEAWTSWGSWSSCSATCGGGRKSRSRECENGEVGVGGCQGTYEEITICGGTSAEECPMWSPWSTWSGCSHSCGTGKKTRSRICINGHLGVGCGDGEPTEELECNTQLCERWSEWGSWSECTATCGGGEKTRARTCENGDIGYGGCEGPELEISMCGGTSAEECPKWSQWSTWSECSVTCNGGVVTRTRICINGHLGDGCGEGETVEELICNSQVCSSWTLWTSWSACTKSCDSGIRERNRDCLHGSPGEGGCKEDNGVGEYDNEICNPQVCPRFGPWSDWSACNATCGGQGIRIHTRVCVGGEVGQLGCEGPVSEDQDCDGVPCPFWSPWDDWGDCTKPCGGGTRSRGRLCVHGKTGDDGCQGDDTETEVCNDESCSYWSAWGAWGACSRTCGNAERFRIRLCINGEIGEAGCDDGSSTEVETCPFKECAGCSPNLELQGLNDGSVACSDGTSVGSICSFACDSNYQLLGSATSICNDSTGVVQWSEEVPTCTERCSDAADIVFIIDSSSSIKEENFKIIRSFIKEIVKRFRIGPDAALIGAIRYNKNVSKLWDLKDHTTIEELLQAISDIPYDGSGTLTGKAIQYAHDYMFRAEAGRRPGVPKMVVVITDGVSFDDVREPSRLLKGQGAQVVAVGIGNVNLGEINEIASDPDRNFATTVSNFDSLPRVVTTIADQIKLCQPIDIPDNCPPQALADMVFIVDSSSSIGDDNFELMRKFIKDIVKEFNVGYDSAMFGLVRYNKDVSEWFQLQDYDTSNDVLNAIDRMPYKGSGTRTGKALRYAAANSFTSFAGARTGVPKVAIVITDGRSQDPVDGAAKYLKEQANVIAIGIEGAVATELSAIASYESNVFTTDFQRLGEVMDRLKMAVCFASRAGLARIE